MIRISLRTMKITQQPYLGRVLVWLQHGERISHRSAKYLCCDRSGLPLIAVTFALGLNLVVGGDPSARSTR